MAETRFKFVSETGEAAGGNQFTVVSFTGHEGISSLYRYEIELKAPLTTVIDLDEILDSPARFETDVDGAVHPVHGILASFDELQTAQNYVYYRAVLVPRLWKLSTYRTNEIYTSEKTLENIIQTVLDASELESADYDLNSLSGTNFLHREYICQFGESDFDFLSRLMEREGVFYYFDHSGLQEKIIFVNSLDYEDIKNPALKYEVATQTSQLHNSVNAWSCRNSYLPKRVTLKDHNPIQPSDDVTGSSDIDVTSHGTDYIYGDNIGDKNEATYLSEIRAEQQLCHKTRYYGESSVPRLQAGYLFGLSLHPNPKYNGKEYLIVEVEHEGLHLDATKSSGAEGKPSKPQYHNSFVAIDATLLFRPDSKTRRPRFHGTVTGFVYAATGSGEAEMDTHGRYRVYMAFDRSTGFRGGDSDPTRKTSTWIRMAQQFVGQDQGIYFPLTGGTEVLISFINGDPDQPVIVGAVPNVAMPSLVNADNRHQHVISTAGMLKVDARGGSKTVLEVNDSGERGTVRGSDDDYEFTEVTTSPQPADPTPLVELTNNPLDEETGYNIITRRYGHEYIFIDGNTYKWDNEKAFCFGNDYEEIHEDEAGIENGEVFDMAPMMQSIGDTLKGLEGDDNQGYGNWEDGGNGLTEKSWGDKCEFHQGRVFAWSGGRGPGGSLETYSYGNGYTENLLESDRGTSADLSFAKTEHMDTYKEYAEINDHLGHASIEKTFGPTYSYQNGFSADVKVGDSHSKTFGNSYSTVWGNDRAQIHGDQYEDIHGNTESHHLGAWNKEVFTGTKGEYCLAATNSMSLSATNSMTLGVASDIFVGVKNDMSLALSNEMALSAYSSVHVGACVEIQLAAVLKTTLGVGIDFTSNKIVDSVCDMDAGKLKTTISALCIFG